MKYAKEENIHQENFPSLDVQSIVPSKAFSFCCSPAYYSNLYQTATRVCRENMSEVLASSVLGNGPSSSQRSRFYADVVQVLCHRQATLFNGLVDQSLLRNIKHRQKMKALSRKKEECINAPSKKDAVNCSQSSQKRKRNRSPLPFTELGEKAVKKKELSIPGFLKDDSLTASHSPLECRNLSVNRETIPPSITPTSIPNTVSNNVFGVEFSAFDEDAWLLSDDSSFAHTGLLSKLMEEQQKKMSSESNLLPER